MKLLFEIPGSAEKQESRALARVLQHPVGVCRRCCAKAHCLRQVWCLITVLKWSKARKERMRPRKWAPSWNPLAGPPPSQGSLCVSLLRSMSHRGLQPDPALCEGTATAMVPSGTFPPPTSLLKPLNPTSILKYSESLQRGERNINSEETDGAIIKSSLSPYFFPLLLLFRTASPKADPACTPHVHFEPARWSKGRAENPSELMALIWWPDKAQIKNQLLGNKDKPWLLSKRTHKSEHLLLALL